MPSERPSIAMQQGGAQPHYADNLLIFMVGGTGIEPVTPAV
jgi:hypothetical protein